MDLSAIGRQFGLDEAQTRAALEALTPVVASGIRRTAQTPEGLQDIFSNVLTGGHGQRMNADGVQFDNAQNPGNEILGQIFGSKDVSRGVAQQLSATSGIGAAIIKKLLPIVASIVMGQVAKKMGAGNAAPAPGGGGLGDILKDIMGGGRAAPQAEPEPLPDTAPSTPGGGGLEDILNEILKGGKGGVVMKRIPQDQMGDILKDIFGGNVQLPGSGDQPRYQPSEDAVKRGRKTIDDALGGGARGGNDADILLDSVERSIRGGR
jgi:hypothetical protein